MVDCPKKLEIYSMIEIRDLKWINIILSNLQSSFQSLYFISSKQNIWIVCLYLHRITSTQLYSPYRRGSFAKNYSNYIDISDIGILSTDLIIWSLSNFSKQSVLHITCNIYFSSVWIISRYNDNYSSFSLQALLRNEFASITASFSPITMVYSG